MVNIHKKILRAKAKLDFFLAVICAPKNAVMIDCGANVGKYTSILSLRKDCTVYAFEPNPDAFKVLLSKFTKKTNVICFNKAVAVNQGKVSLYLHHNNLQDQVKWSVASSMFSDKVNVSAENYVEVEAIDFNSFVTSLDQKVSVVKMDVEGAEYDILLKLINDDVISTIDKIFVETHASRIKSLSGKHVELVKLIEDKSINNINLNWA